MTNVATWSTYNMWSVLNEVVDKNLRMFPILFKQFKHLQHCFFDIKQLTWEGGMSVKPKDIPGIESTITVDWYAIKWLDYGLFDFSTQVKTTLDWTVAATNDIVLKDNSWFAVNDTIYFINNGAWTSDDVDAVITAINADGETITVKITAINSVAASTSDTFDLLAWATVERGFWTRNDEEEITRPSSNYAYTEYKSYIQHFSRRISFTKAEMNKEYKYEWDAKNEVEKRFTYNIGIMFQEVNKAIYKGKNRWPGTGANDKMEMLWLEQIARETGAIVDLSSSSDSVGDLFNQFELAFQSGSVMGHESLQLLVNDKFLTELSRVERSKIQYDSVVDSLQLVVPKLSTAYGMVELIRDPMLNKLYAGYSVAFTMPKSLVKLWVRENQNYAPKGWVTKADQSIRVYPVIDNIREKDQFDIEFELGMIAGWMSATNSSYRMIKWFSA